MSDAIPSEVKRGEAGRFIVPPKSPGRPKGSRNKLGEAFIEALHDDFAEHGTAVIEKVRIEDPVQYVKVIASIVPKEIHHTVDDVKELDDATLHSRFLAAVARLNRGGGVAGGDRAPPMSGSVPH